MGGNVSTVPSANAAEEAKSGTREPQRAESKPTSSYHLKKETSGSSSRRARRTKSSAARPTDEGDEQAGEPTEAQAKADPDASLKEQMRGRVRSSDTQSSEDVLARRASVRDREFRAANERAEQEAELTRDSQEGQARKIRESKAASDAIRRASVSREAEKGRNSAEATWARSRGISRERREAEALVFEFEQRARARKGEERHRRERAKAEAMRERARREQRERQEAEERREFELMVAKLRRRREEVAAQRKAELELARLRQERALEAERERQERERLERERKEREAAERAAPEEETRQKPERKDSDGSRIRGPMWFAIVVAIVIAIALIAECT